MEPTIRFSGYKEKWEKTSLKSKDFSIVAGGDPDKRLLKAEGLYPVVANALTDNGIVGFYDNYRIEGPAVTVTGRGDVGKAVARNYSFTPVVRLLAIKSSHDINFLANAINRCKILKESTGVPQLTTSQLSDLCISFPINKSEEAQIGNFYKTLDDVLLSILRKLESLKQLKSASMISMFPQNGETKPRVRFKGFERDWELKKFSELYEPSSVKNTIFGPDRIISVANMYFKEVAISDSEYLHSYNVMRIGDIAFEGHSNNEFANGRFVENIIGDGIVSHIFVVLKPISQRYDLWYWKYCINNERMMKSVLQRCTKRSTMMNDLVVSDFLKESILVPSYEEQVLIGQFFANIDHRISLETQRLEKLKQVKSACLDKMFV